MFPYSAPTKDMIFNVNTVGKMNDLQEMTPFSEATPDMVEAIIEEGGRQASEIAAPLNHSGDIEGSRVENGGVVTPTGFKEAYAHYVEAGWNGLMASTDYEGQGLPFLLAIAVQEAWASANMSLSLCPMLNHGSVEAITHHASDELKDIYLAKMVLGQWTGTMNLTEPQAGSDVGAVSSKAKPLSDGSYAVSGSKIFITFGDHDMAENIIHLVLARTPNAPAGTRGISMFLVPKFLVNDDGSLGADNNVRCVSVEHKLGIHASPTCVMSFGDEGESVGWLVGEENKGMKNMFTMMNHARINVGLQGVAIAERATQHAVAYAKERVQGNAIGMDEAGPHAIIHHPDVRRMLMTMRAMTDGIRALTYLNASAVDHAHGSSELADKKKWQGLADLLTPITKSFCTDVGVEVSSLGVQVHGGMGFVEETGAAQFYRDARIAPIYEGTNGIQAMDLVGRKFSMDGGVHWQGHLKTMEDIACKMSGTALEKHKKPLEKAVEETHQASVKMIEMSVEQPKGLGVGSSYVLRMYGISTCAALLAEMAMTAEERIKAGDSDTVWLQGKIDTAQFFMEHILPQVSALYSSATAGDETVFQMDVDNL